MRLVRVIAIILFVASLGSYVGMQYYENKQKDDTKPVITSDTDVLTLSVEDGDEHLTDGLTATDEKDGDLTGDILVTGKSLFTEKGTATVKYVVFDHDNNYTTYKRTVTYEDYRSPEFSLTDPLEFNRGTSVDFSAGIQATDQIDGDLTDKIKIVQNDIISSELGVYPVKVEVTNSYGDTAEVELNVLIRDRQGESAIHLNSYLLYVDKGSTFDPIDSINYITDSYGTRYDVEMGKIQKVIYAFDSDHEVFTDVNVTGTVDTSTPGCYQLTYSYESDNSEAVAYQTVVVRE